LKSQKNLAVSQDKAAEGQQDAGFEVLKQTDWLFQQVIA